MWLRLKPWGGWRLQDHTNNIEGKVAAYRVLAVETVITAFLALLLSISVDIVAAYSAILGGLAFVAPNVLFARYAFRHSAIASANLAVAWFYIGEAIKIITTILIFAVCFVWVNPINVMVLFASFIGMVVVNLIGLAVLAPN
ncbi:MAG: ATP synthase subunit I [Gammaproteobacteria bacterium]